MSLLHDEVHRAIRNEVPGIPGVGYRDLELFWKDRIVSVYSVTIRDVLSAFAAGSLDGKPEGHVWCVLSPSAFSLSRWLSCQDFDGVRVLEIGCGSGSTGLAAAVAGGDVLVTDCRPAAVELARRNARRNGVNINAAVADWRNWPIQAGFDCIIGSDITYQPSVFDALLHVLERALLPGGEVLLADPGRPATAAFRKRVLEAGWAWESFELPKETVLAGESSEAIYLHHLRRGHCPKQ